MRRREALMALGGLALSPLAQASALAERLAAASRGGRYVEPSGAELAASVALFEAILAGAPEAAIASLAQPLALRWERLEHGLGLLVEAPGALHGRGAYAFRGGQALRRVLQVPHAFKDLGTRELGLALFAGGGFQAAAWNTVPRWRERDGRRIGSDLAHLAASTFNAFTGALARSREALTVIQLHGFSSERRGSALAAILSNGTRRPEAGLEALAACLEGLLGRPVAVFPTQVGFLGATTNAQRAALAGRQRFIHLEMDKALRDALRAEPALLAGLGRCLVEATP